MRFFNTAGPVRPDDHYAIPPLDRVDIDELLDLIRTKRYFVLHAPRQTGKTSALIALRDLLNSGEAGDFRCVHTNVEVGQVARDDMARGMRAILSRLAMRARLSGDSFPHESLGYMAQCGAEEGHLVVFDRRTGKRRRNKGTEERGSEAGGSGRRQDGRKVAVWTL